MNRPDLEIVGVDRTPTMIEVENRFQTDLGFFPRVRLEFGDMTDFVTHAAGEFDLISTIFSLHHLPTPGALNRFLSQIGGLLKSSSSSLWIFDHMPPRTEAGARYFSEAFQSEVPDYSKKDSYNSTRAAWSFSEMQAALKNEIALPVEGWPSRIIPFWQAHHYLGAVSVADGDRHWRPAFALGQTQRLGRSLLQKFILPAAMLALILAGSARALGTSSYSSELISARSLGQGGTGVAGVHDDPISVYLNPAAMTAMKGTQATAGLSYVNARPVYRSGVASPGGLGASYTEAGFNAVSGARATSVVVPDFGVTTQLWDGRLAAGLAAVSPYGLETHFDGDSPIRYRATDARLRIVDITPAVAYKINEIFSVGGGLDYFRAVEGSLEKKINTKALNYGLVLQATGNAGLAAALATGADANSRLYGTGDGWGYHLGTTIRPSENHQIGLVYHSAVKIRLKGNTQITGLSGTATSVFGGPDFQVNASAPLFMPQNLQIGYAWMPDAGTQVEIDASWYDYYSGRQLGVNYGQLTASQFAVLNDPSANPLRFNPRKTINFGLGVNRKLSATWEGRIGAYYEAASLPENAFDPSFVDLPRYALTFGAGYQVAPSMTIDFAYNAIFFHGRSINAPDPNTLGSGYSGNFNSFAHVVSLALTYRSAAHF